MRLFVFLLGTFVLTASAEEPDWNNSWDGMLYGYANSTVLRDDSILNPGNQVAHLSQHSDSAELRLNFKAENETVRLTARSIASTREARNVFGTQQRNEAYLSQWQVRVRAAEAWNIAAGREVMNWGAAQFRSPSSPFYFDNGRSDPLRELAGMDALKLSWTPDMQRSAILARIVSSGYGAAQPDAWRNSWLAKFDQRGDEWAYGLVTAKSPHLPAFYGAHGQRTLSDTLMLYGEASSSARPYALQSPADSALPYTVQAPSSRRTTALAGAAYTFESGTSLAAEYLRDGHGYTAVEERAYFQRATTQIGLPLGLMPRLLGRDYLHLVWQSNMLGEAGYWRMMYTRGFTGGGNELAGYGETVLSAHIIVYALAVLPVGDARQEFSALFQRSVTAGLKIAIP
ncbi:MAG: hypothetical protein HY935_01190 [Nitrosomonadales bacterium]|nr:hypothetical protein [Nitrosomonadales bacterium]